MPRLEPTQPESSRQPRTNAAVDLNPGRGSSTAPVSSRPGDGSTVRAPARELSALPLPAYATVAGQVSFGTGLIPCHWVARSSRPSPSAERSRGARYAVTTSALRRGTLEPNAGCTQRKWLSAHRTGTLRGALLTTRSLTAAVDRLSGGLVRRMFGAWNPPSTRRRGRPSFT
jgi:hypothetical protein